jgi:predicted KAP-like P-loop ATPase
MSSSATDSPIPQTGMIITDEVAPSPILDFGAYTNAIVKMIKESIPKFSIGIYGEWGSGKTTLMKSIEEKLSQESNKDILTVWFNAWRYEREEPSQAF